MLRLTAFMVSLFLVSAALAPAAAIGGEHRLGAGLHYLNTLGDIKKTPTGDLDLSKSSFSIMGSYRNDMGLLKIEGDVEYIFDYIGTGHAMWQPSAWALVGRLIYGGGGIGIGYTDNAWQSNPFYALRAGVNLDLRPVDFDIFASYRFQSDQDLKQLNGEDLDSLTFAALVRFAVGKH